MRKGPNQDQAEKEKILQRMKEMREAGLNNSQIARECDCSAATVTRYLGVRIRKEPDPQPA